MRRTVLDARVVTGAGGGIEKTLIEGAKHHDGTPYETVLAFVHPRQDRQFDVLRERAARHGARLHDRSEWSPISPATVAWYARQCRDHSIAIWHGHDYKTDLIGLMLQPLFGFSMVCTMHGWVQDTWRTRLYFELDRHAIRRYSQVICVSSDLYSAARSLGVPENRLTLIENGVDADEYRPANHLANDGGLLRIGAAGRLSQEKGFVELIEAVELLLDSGLSLELRIAGAGVQYDELRARIQRSQHRDSIALVGHVSDMRTFFGEIDVFCVSSLREGLPNVLLEAMAMQLPIVSTSAGGLETFLRHERDSLVCPPGSVEELARALRRIAVDPDLRKRLAQAARRRVVADCSFAERMQRVFAVYDRLR